MPRHVALWGWGVRVAIDAGKFRARVSGWAEEWCARSHNMGTCAILPRVGRHYVAVAGGARRQSDKRGGAQG